MRIPEFFRRTSLRFTVQVLLTIFLVNKININNTKTKHKKKYNLQLSPPPPTTTITSTTTTTPATTSNDLSSSTDVLKKMLGLQLNINDGPPNLEQPSTSAATAAAKQSDFDQLQKISVEDIFHMVFKT